MFANNEITERGLLHRLLERESAEVTYEERLVWARSIDGSINEAVSPVAPLRNRIARPVVVLSAAPALVAVAAALRNEDVAVSREALESVRAFMTDGIDSPLYGSDPLAARRGADALRRLVAGSEVAQPATAASAT